MQQCLVFKADKITDEMIFAAVQAILGAEGASLLPSNEDLRITSSIVALEVLQMAKSQGMPVLTKVAL